MKRRGFTKHYNKVLKQLSRVKRAFISAKSRHRNNERHGIVIVLFFIAHIPILFLLLLLYPLTVVALMPKHPCYEHVYELPDAERHVVTTAYSSTPDQTDDTPFITADQTYVYWGVVAANFLPFGTCVRFPDEFGEQWFVVHDRKHKRFSDSVDVWHYTRQDAKQFGVKVLKTQIWYK